MAEDPRAGDNNALDELRKHLEKYPIDVYVKKSKRVGKENHWSVVIRDRGAGISRDDIRYLQCIGSSRKNPRRAERMRGMPEWMKPAGYFGIGLQSVFLFTDRVVLRSRADDRMETIEIELKERPGSKDPQILVRSVTGKKALTRPGTRVEFVLHEPTVPSGYSFRGGYEETERITKNYDPLLHDELPILPSKVRDATRIFAESALAHVRLEGNTIKRDGRRSDALDRFFDAESGIELALAAREYGHTSFQYRGRRTNEHFSHLFFSMVAAWHRDNASKILTINREKVRFGAQKDVREGINRALLNVLPRYYEKVKSDPARIEERRYLALAAEVVELIRLKEEIPKEAEWKKICYSNSKYTLGDIVEANLVRLIEDPLWSENTSGSRLPEIKPSEDGKGFTIACQSVEPWFWELLRGRKIILQSTEPLTGHPCAGWSTKFEWLALREEPEPPKDIVGSQEVLKVIIRDAASPHGLRARRTIPCSRKFWPMSFSPGAESALWYVDPCYVRLSPRALFPFRIESDGKISLAGIDELIRWTYEHRLDKATSERDVARAVLDLVQTADEWLREEWGDRVDYSVDELRRRLRKAYGPDVLPKPTEGSS